jgi:septum formation protein
VLVRPAAIDESLRAGESPENGVLRLARAKAESVAAQTAERPILAADTIVVVDGRPLGKPRDRDEARSTLSALSGRWHEVLTGVALITDEAASLSELSRTRVRFAEIDSEEIAVYTAGPEPYDKAGAYGIQGAAGWFVDRIEGSVSNVVGLPLEAVRALLQRAGLPIPPLRPLL